MARDRLIDGWRGVAVLCVVSAHALAYRFDTHWLLQRLAEPLAEMGVQLFFVISGYIITTLLLKEQARDGRISIPAFYARRFARILPPLLAYYTAILLLTPVLGLDVAKSAVFVCNVADCGWLVAHTWSLAVEEQFYLAWPLLLGIIPKRAPVLLGTIAALLTGYLIFPHQWHSNWISFACIAAGAFYATSCGFRDLIGRLNSFTWLAIGLAFAVIPMGTKFAALTPLMIPVILFGARHLPVRHILQSTALNVVGLGSYSLYLWQQAFLGPSDNLPLIGLPVVVMASYFLIAAIYRVGPQGKRMAWLNA
jgi:peptidoglycan/LPS O-acetylase OafA/YrhL